MKKGDAPAVHLPGEEVEEGVLDEHGQGVLQQRLLEVCQVVVHHLEVFFGGVGG